MQVDKNSNLFSVCTETMKRAIACSYLEPKRSKAAFTPFTYLPVDVAVYISSFLGLEDMLVFRQTCKLFREAAPFLKIDHTSSCHKCKYTTAVLMVDGTQMTGEQFTTATNIDGADYLMAIVVRGVPVSFADSAEALLRQSVFGMASGKPISIYSTISASMTTVAALMNHPRVTDFYGNDEWMQHLVRNGGSWTLPGIGPLGDPTFFPVTCGFFNVYKLSTMGVNFEELLKLFVEQDESGLESIVKTLCAKHIAHMFRGPNEDVDDVTGNQLFFFLDLLLLSLERNIYAELAAFNAVLAIGYNEDGYEEWGVYRFTEPIPLLHDENDDLAQFDEHVNHLLDMILGDDA